MEKKYTPKRSDENDRISISLPKELLEKIDAAAKADNRNRSQFMVVRLKEIVAELESVAEKKPAPMITALESPKVKKKNARN